MRYPAGHKEQTRAKILAAAARAFRRDGYQASGLDKVMDEAGLTAGGFYAHFASKEMLLAEALAAAAAEAGSRLVPGPEGAASFLARYLDPSHARGAAGGCPLPSLAPEVARAGAVVKAGFEAIVRDFAARIEERAGGDVPHDRALALVALCVGGLAVARAVHDERLADRILAACRDLAAESLAPAQPE